jgi:hypothetical protein
MARAGPSPRFVVAPSSTFTAHRRPTTARC